MFITAREEPGHAQQLQQYDVVVTVQIAIHRSGRQVAVDVMDRKGGIRVLTLFWPHAAVGSTRISGLIGPSGCRRVDGEFRLL
ncbi:hypothetical protein [Phyllobacterium ifriqiyense]|uniref:hypothetical protein n=1 Tax=Phyllobacterium ifriqiyense TaxID=314238 RepID=UPI0027D8E82B|nr:hypothetical protein [Phyllobacterium ifriqiyense]